MAGIVEHASHSRHASSVPEGEIANRPGSGAVAGRGEHGRHTRHASSVPGGEI